MADGVWAKMTMTSNIPRIAAGLERSAELVVAKTAQDMEANAKSNVRSQGAIDTGNLLNSIQATKVGAGHWRVAVGADYGMYVEWGTRHMAARPFLAPAVQTVRPAFLAAMRAVAG